MVVLSPEFRLLLLLLLFPSKYIVSTPVSKVWLLGWPLEAGPHSFVNKRVAGGRGTMARSLLIKRQCVHFKQIREKAHLGYMSRHRGSHRSLSAVLGVHGAAAQAETGLSGGWRRGSSQHGSRELAPGSAGCPTQQGSAVLTGHLATYTHFWSSQPGRGLLAYMGGGQGHCSAPYRTGTAPQ